MSLHYSHRAQSSLLPQQQPSSSQQSSLLSSSAVSSNQTTSSSSTSGSNNPFLNNNHHLHHQIISGSSLSTITSNVDQSFMDRNISNSFNNNNNINSCIRCPYYKKTLNVNNHPAKNGSVTYINYCSGTRGKFEAIYQVYENNDNPEPIELSITLEDVFDQGAFGRVRTARIENRLVAVKQVLQDTRYRNRELPLMKQLNHCNIVTLLYYYYHTEEKEESCPKMEIKNIYLNLIMEHVPSNLNKLIMTNNRNRKGSRHIPHGDLYSLGPVAPLFIIKVCMYQIFRALAYLHSEGICHRDIKPNNLLYNPETGVLKICDFGSAKQLKKGENNVSYICARFYRAPELLFGATDYNEKIDLWSTGVVFSELLLGQPIFHENSGIDQLVLIISKLGTPNKEQLEAMNPKYAQYSFPQVKAQSWESLFPNAPTEALDLISQLFQYNPSHRIAPMHACAHQFFDELREPNKKWLKNYDLPPLFNFSEKELSSKDSNLIQKLLPYKTTQNNNIAIIQPTQQQMVCNARNLSQRNHMISSSIGGVSHYPNNIFPINHQNNFQQFIQKVSMGHYPTQSQLPINNNHQIIVENNKQPQINQNFNISGPSTSLSSSSSNTNNLIGSTRVIKKEFDELGNKI